MIKIRTKPIRLLSCMIISAACFMQCTPDRPQNDTTRSELLRQADLLRNSDPEMSDSLYRIIISESHKGPRASYIHALVSVADNFITAREFDSAGFYLDKATQSISGNPDTSLIVSVLNIKGKLYYQEGSYDSAISTYLKGMSMLDKKDIEHQKTAFTLNAGKSFLGKGDYTEAANLLEEGLRLAIKNNNNEHKMVAFHSMAMLNSEMNQYEEAVKYTRKEIDLALAIGDTLSYAQSMMNLGIYYKNSGKTDSALLAYSDASKAFVAMGDSMSLIMTLYNKGIILKNAGRYGEAEGIMKLILKYCREHNLYDGQTFSLTALAGICEETNREQEGLMLIDTAIELAEKQNITTKLSILYERKHSLLAALGRYREAYSTSLKAVRLNDSLSGIEVKKEILALKAKYESEEKEAENRLLKKDNQIIKSKLLIQKLALTVSLLMVSLSILGFLLYRKKIRYHQAYSEEKTLRLENENKAGLLALEHAALLNKLKEEELKRMQAETRLKSEQIENLELQTGLKQQELVFQALARTELTQLLTNISEKLQPFKTRLPRKKDQEEFAQMLTDITRESTKDPLSEFELLFRQLHPDFYEKLLCRCPQLSKSELNISAMVRLNLSTKDMASLVNLSISTIETNRYHIRKKLGLEQGENLTTCLMQI